MTLKLWQLSINYSNHSTSLSLSPTAREMWLSRHASKASTGAYSLKPTELKRATRAIERSQRHTVDASTALAHAMQSWTCHWRLQSLPGASIRRRPPTLCARCALQQAESRQPSSASALPPLQQV